MMNHHPRLLTLGHGTLPGDEFAALLEGAGVRRLVDVRRYPGSRRHPQFARAALERRLPELGVGYRWAEELGGRRRAFPDSPNGGLRNASFRGYADYMATVEFAAGIDRLLADARAARTSVLCSESLWWRCHRRLIADHLVLVAGAGVGHLLHDGGVTPHVLTGTAHRDGDVVGYPADTPSLL